MKKTNNKANILLFTWIFNRILKLLFSLFTILGYGIMLAQLAYFTALVTVSNWTNWAIAIFAYLIFALILATIIKQTKYNQYFMLGDNFIRIAGSLLFFLNQTYYMLKEQTDPNFGTPLVYLGASLFFLVASKFMTNYYYDICLNKEPLELDFDSFSTLSPEEKQVALITAHQKTIYPSLRNSIFVYDVLNRKNIKTGADEYALFYYTTINIFGFKKNVHLFKAIISIDN